MPTTKRKKRKTRKKQKGGTGKDKFIDTDLAKFLDDTVDEQYLYYFYYSDAKIDKRGNTITNDGYAKFHSQPDSYKMERQKYISSLITALQKYHVAKPIISQQQIENTIHILQMLNKNSMWEMFRRIFVPDNVTSYTDPRENYMKETDIIMKTLPNPLGFAKDTSSNVLQNMQFEIVEKFPEGPLDRLLHAVYGVENNIYMQMLLGDGKSDELKKIMDENKKSQTDIFTFANSNPIIKKMPIIKKIK